MKVMERIVRDELMVKCGHLIDPRQHGFIKNRSCSTQLVDMATFGEYFPSVVTRDSPCWIPGTAPMI